MPRKENIDKVEKIKTLIGKASAIYFADCSQVNANDMSILRGRLRESVIVTKVVKNRLALLAFKDLGFDDAIRPFLTGPTSLIVTTEDPILPARLIKEMTKKFTEIKIKGAYFDDTIFSAEQFDFLANLPARPELQVTLVQILAQPVVGLVILLENLIVDLIFILEQLKKKKEQS